MASFPPGNRQTFAAGSSDILSAAHRKKITTVLLLRYSGNYLPTGSDRYGHNWLRAVELDLSQLNIGLAFAWRKAAVREDW